MINSIFRKHLYEGILANYIDNFVILTKTKKVEKKNHIIFKGNRETQSLFQIVKM